MTQVQDQPQGAINEDVRTDDALYDATAAWYKVKQQKAALNFKIRELGVDEAQDKVVALLELEPDQVGDIRVLPETAKDGPASFLLSSKMSDAGDVEFTRESKRRTSVKAEGE